MENVFIETLKVSPVVALFAWLYYNQSINYKNLVNEIQHQNNKREEKYQQTIEKNQGIIQELAQKLNIVETIKIDIECIKTKFK